MSNVRRSTVERITISTLLVCSLVFAHQEASAQVGHRPESSPYRDLMARKVLSFQSGYLSGSSGKADVGPGSGPFAGARFDIHLGGPAGMTFGTSLASLERVLIDPTWGPANRTLDTTTQTVLLLDAGIDMLLTGEKTWRGMVPYIGGGLGLALGGGVDADSLSGYSFSTHLTTGPRIGLWILPSNRITIKIEGRDILWRLKYPEEFFAVPENEPDATPVLDANVMKNNEWVHHLGLTISVGYTIGN